MRAKKMFLPIPYFSFDYSQRRQLRSENKLISTRAKREPGTRKRQAQTLIAGQRRFYKMLAPEIKRDKNYSSAGTPLSLFRGKEKREGPPEFSASGKHEGRGNHLSSIIVSFCLMPPTGQILKYKREKKIRRTELNKRDVLINSTCCLQYKTPATGKVYPRSPKYVYIRKTISKLSLCAPKEENKFQRFCVAISFYCGVIVFVLILKEKLLLHMHFLCQEVPDKLLKFFPI